MALKGVPTSGERVIGTGVDAPTMTTTSQQRPLSEEQIQQVLQLQREGKVKEKRTFSSDYDGGLDVITADDLAIVDLENTSAENVTCKDSDWMARWVSKRNDGLGVGVRYWMGRVPGLRLATEDDVNVPGLDPADGHFYYGDLVLVVAPRAIMARLIKQKDLGAYNKLHPSQKIQRANAEIKAAVDGEGDPTLKDAQGNPMDVRLTGEDRARASGKQARQGLSSAYIPQLDESQRAGL